MQSARNHRWTNSSVLAFAAGGDPLERAHSAAAELLQVAAQHGLTGPPVDVLALAEAIGISVRPRDDLLDARVLAVDVGGKQQLVIEYNPSRPRGRLRFSVAHELAHSRFSDVAERPRHRTATGSVAEPTNDMWELELLCDVIAADLLVPDDAVAGLLAIDPDIDFIMENRRRWDVSTEALLRRLVAATPRPLTMLATSRPQSAAQGAMRIDYVARSASAERERVLGALGHGDLLHQVAPLLDCAAVGQTLRGRVEIDGEWFSVQSVGVPGYPGSQWPRVLALIESELQSSEISNLEFVVSDLVEVAPATSAIVFAHVVSDSVRAWSHFGAAGSLEKSFPDFARAFHSWTIASPKNLQLGEVHFVERAIDGRNIGVASLVAQEGFGKGDPRIRYDAFEDSLNTLAEIASSRNAEVHVPRLGAGQAGGRWDRIQELLIAALVDAGLKVVVHTQPAKFSPAKGRDV